MAEKKTEYTTLGEAKSIVVSIEAIFPTQTIFSEEMENALDTLRGIGSAEVVLITCIKETPEKAFQILSNRRIS